LRGLNSGLSCDVLVHKWPQEKSLYDILCGVWVRSASLHAKMPVADEMDVVESSVLNSNQFELLVLCLTHSL
jgi:hypothetical protein